MSRDPLQHVGARLAGGFARAAGVAAVAALLFAPVPAHAFSVEPFRGHLGIGYAKLFVSEAPGGSLSAEGGVDYPLASRLRLGASVGYDLLGSRTVERGSLVANLDYSAFSAALLAHWTPRRLGPVGRISAGLALMNAHVELSTSGGGAQFADLALSETAPGLAFDVTMMSRRESPVRVGLEIGTRIGFLDEDTWTLGAMRLVFHY